MIKDKNISITELKKQLKQLHPEELMKLLVETYKISDKVKNLIKARLKGDIGVDNLLRLCKEKIKNEFLPEKGFGKLRVSIVQKIILDFKSVSKDDKQIIDLILFSVEMGVEFINEYGDISENMVDYLFEAYDKVVNIINKKNRVDLFEHFKNRLEEAITNTKGVGCWGIEDSFEGSYSEINLDKGLN
ncbi:MAG: hypothetical protein ACI8WT_001424 [Clostridium sp.]|jgi:hypothetical protein